MDVMRLPIRSIQTSIQYSLFLLSTFIFVTASQAETSADSINKDLMNTLKEHMVLIDGGRFMMGSDSSAALKREQPSHQVTLDDFYMGQTEVTQALFLEVMGWNNSFFNCQTCPVNNISWLNMMLFIERLNKPPVRYLGCRPKPSGSMPHGVGSTRKVMNSVAPIILAMSHGTRIMQSAKHIPWRRKNRMGSAYMI
jgi:hypothetical protein